MLVDPQRKRKIRLVVALSVAVLLAVALVYTSFAASNQAKQPSELVGLDTSGSVDMTGEVVKGSIIHAGNGIAFRVVDREAEGKGKALPVTYQGTVPDPFRGGREIVLTGSLENGTFVGEPETLITKCPSKFTTKSDG